MRHLGRIRTFSELSKLDTFSDRYEYLKIGGSVGKATFGGYRPLNQNFYRSAEWRRLRREVILRDLGCDLGVPGYDIYGKVYIHHMNPVDVDDLVHATEYLLDPEYLITVSFGTHQAIHYGSFDLIDRELVDRRPNDTCPWKGAR